MLSGTTYTHPNRHMKWGKNQRKDCKTWKQDHLIVMSIIQINHKTNKGASENITMSRREYIPEKWSARVALSFEKPISSSSDNSCWLTSGTTISKQRKLLGSWTKQMILRNDGNAFKQRLAHTDRRYMSSFNAYEIYVQIRFF